MGTAYSLVGLRPLGDWQVAALGAEGMKLMLRSPLLAGEEMRPVKLRCVVRGYNPVKTGEQWGCCRAPQAPAVEGSMWHLQWLATPS